jgi:hypothetical protein
MTCSVSEILLRPLLCRYLLGPCVLVPSARLASASECMVPYCHGQQLELERHVNELESDWVVFYYDLRTSCTGVAFS